MWCKPRYRAGQAMVTPVVAAMVLVGCGGGDLDLSPLADEGRAIANEAGCGSCHGPDGQGGVGPAWTGLYGSSVALDDGGSVIADDDYLRRSIVDPSAQKVEGFTIEMPANELSDQQIEAVIAYIRELE
jgi:cytochrome c oxidase subunit 2